MSEHRGSPALPQGWVSAKLSDVAHIIMGQSPPSSTYNTEGLGLPFFQGKAEFGELYPSLRKWCSEPKKVADAEDVLISVRAPVGPTNLCPEKACIGRGLAAIRGLGGTEARYLLYLLRAFESRIAEQGTGTTFAAISGTDLRSLGVPFCPLPEQRRIVAKIEELFTRLDAGVEALERVQALLERYRQSVLKEAFEGRLTAAWREAHRDELEPASVLLERIRREREAAGPKKGRRKQSRGMAPVDASSLPELPERWEWARLSELGELDRGKSRHRPRNDPSLYGGPYPFVQTGDVRHAGGRLRTYTQTYSELGLAQSRLWPRGTLCITIAANIAETAILDFDACFPDSVVGFLASPSHCSTPFVELYFRAIREDLERVAPATAQKNINLATLRSILVPLPPIREQEEVVMEVERRLSVADAVGGYIGDGGERAARLRQSILRHAFEGRLVPQDPTDEPAEVLLERIRAARQEQGRLL